MLSDAYSLEWSIKKGAATFAVRIYKKGQKVYMFAVKGLISDQDKVLETAHRVQAHLNSGFSYCGPRVNVWWQKFDDQETWERRFNGPF